MKTKILRNIFLNSGAVLASARLQAARAQGRVQRTVTQFCSQGLGEVKLGCTKNTRWVLSSPHQLQKFARENSIKEAISIMKPKQIFISILAVLFVFPLMGTFAQQAPNSGSIEVITTFDYPGTGNSTLPQKINERGDVVGNFLDSNGVTRAFSGSAMVALASES